MKKIKCDKTKKNWKKRLKEKVKKNENVKKLKKTYFMEKLLCLNCKKNSNWEKSKT